MRLVFVCALIAAVTTVSRAQPASPYFFSTFAGRALVSGNVDGSGTNARFNRPWGITVDAARNVYVTDAANFTVRKITPDGTVTTLAGSGGNLGTADGQGSIARFGSISASAPTLIPPIAGPFAIGADGNGLIWVADSFSHTIRRITSAGVVSTYSGAALNNGYIEGPVANARYSAPWGMAVDSSGVAYVADTFNHVIRRIAANGTVSTIAGSVGDYGSADGMGPGARFFYPVGIAVDSSGRVYVADANSTIRRLARVSPNSDTWESTTLAGAPQTWGLIDGTGAAARFGLTPSVSSTGGFAVRIIASVPFIPAFPGFAYNLGEMPALAADSAGNVFVADYANNAIRMITSSGVVTTIGGSTAAGSVDGAGSAARFFRPTGIAVDSAGTLYIVDSGNHTIRKGNIGSPPTIQVQPQNQNAGLGGTVNFAVTASGFPTPTYQWRRNDVPIPGATTNLLSVSNIQLAQAGNYTVVVSNSFGSVTSAIATLTVVSLPVIVTQPQSQTAGIGQTVTLSVNAVGAPAPTYQWLFNGQAISGATGSTLVLTNVQPSASGTYSVRVTNTLGSATSVAATLTVDAVRIVNLSIRTPLVASEPLIVGFVASGGSKSLLVRAVGPTLRDFGVSAAMADPQLSLFNNGVLTVTNDNWGTGPAVAQLTLLASQVGAFQLGFNTLDAALLTTVGDSPMTAEASARNGAGGIVLLELYDAAPTATSRLVNVSTRAKVGSGENALFAGFVLAGTGSKTVLIRAIGPTLGAFGVQGVLTDPRLDVFRTGSTTPVASNDNWGGSAALSNAFRTVGAFALPGAESRDAALTVSLQPGSYSAQVSGVGGLTGEVLLEIYEVP
jgi:sugar lactone lactonase YvrE